MILSLLNLHSPIHHKSWKKHCENIETVATNLHEENLKEEAMNVKKYLTATGEIENMSEAELQKNPIKITASFDGSWKSRGWASKTGIVDVGFDGTGKIIDVIIKHSLCRVCNVLKEKKNKGIISEIEYLEKYVEHEPECEKNHDGSASSMERDGVLALFERSIEKFNLIYKRYVGDGDSSAYSAVNAACPYGPTESIEKEECISHITKRMGSGLRKVVDSFRGKKLSDGKAISGAGRLTIARIDTMQSFYGSALRKNKGDRHNMSKNTHAILKHYSSTPENPSHEDCPEGPDSWCSFNRDLALGTNSHKPIKNPLSQSIVDVIKPVFDRLGSENFLASCELVKTQNLNESFHHVIWSLAPKNENSSLLEIKMAVALGTLFFNRGRYKTLEDTLVNLGHKVTENMRIQWKKIDSDRLRFRDKKRLDINKKRRKELKHCNVKTVQAFIHDEGGQQYKSGHFHGGTSASN